MLDLKKHREVKKVLHGILDEKTFRKLKRVARQYGFDLQEVKKLIDLGFKVTEVKIFDVTAIITMSKECNQIKIKIDIVISDVLVNNEYYIYVSNEKISAPYYVTIDFDRLVEKITNTDFSKLAKQFEDLVNRVINKQSI